MKTAGLKPVWKKRILRAAIVLAFAVASAHSPWTSEYFRHREAVVSPSFSGTALSEGGIFDSGSVGTGSSASRFGLLVPDLVAESRETALVWPNPEIKKGLLRLMRESRNELLVNVYLLTEPDVTAEIVAAKKRGVDVKVILEKDPYRLPGANRKSRDQLLNASVEVFSSKDAFNFVHAKYAVADGKKYVFATGNFTKSTFEKNREYFIFWDDPASADFLRSVFLADFRGSPFVETVPDRFYLAPTDARDKALSFVKSAKKSVFVFAPSVSDDEFVKTLNDAAERGLKVGVCLAKDARAEDFAKFSERVLVVATNRPQLHAKTVLTDRSALFVGSANFTRNSLDNNREVGVVLASSGTLRNYENTLLRDCKW